MKYLRTEYPRPQMQRSAYLPLNGEWEFEFDDENLGIKRGFFKGETTLDKKINVPFTYQYEASGIGDLSYHPIMWYKRDFTLTSAQLKKGVLLCFNGADYVTDVFINGCFVISNKGAYKPFNVDITPYVKAENTIVVRCCDTLDEAVPRGKQSYTNEKFGCWYVPNSGIWQSVWVEFFEKDYLDFYTAFPDVDAKSFYGEVNLHYGRIDKMCVKVSFKDCLLKQEEVEVKGTHFKYSVSLENTLYTEDMLWNPESPNFLSVEYTFYSQGVLCDSVKTRLGMRKISMDGDKWLINGKPIYQRLILDQGYWRVSGITPPSVDEIKKDIELSIQMGFNGARKHQKFEDPYFYYLAEEAGFLCWCEMPSAYNYVAYEQLAYMTEWQEIVKNAVNFASIICYVPLNESWGVFDIVRDKSQQNFARSMYFTTKALDPTRPVSTNDGWENLDYTDIISVHDYAFDCSTFDKYKTEDIDALYPVDRKLMAEGCSYKGQPVILSEFGGIAMAKSIQEGSWGYNTSATDDAELYTRLENLIIGTRSKFFCGFCYTQLTDVQQEVNGLLDEDHNPKFDIEILRNIILK